MAVVPVGGAGAGAMPGIPGQSSPYFTTNEQVAIAAREANMNLFSASNIGTSTEAYKCSGYL